MPLVIVMPDGENAWYTNAANKGPRFEDYIADDLVTDVESKYRVIRARYGRAIAGRTTRFPERTPGTTGIAALRCSCRG